MFLSSQVVVISNEDSTKNSRAKHHGTMCGILESIHKVRVPRAEWAELEVPLEAAVRCGAVILGDDREAIGRSFSCISRRNCCKTRIPGHTSLG